MVAHKALASALCHINGAKNAIRAHELACGGHALRLNLEGDGEVKSSSSHSL